MRTLFLFSVFLLSVFSISAQGNTQYVSGIVLLENASDFKITKLEKALGIKANEANAGEFGFIYHQSSVSIKLVESAIPKADWEAAALISWIWKNAEAEVAGHQAHLVVTVSGSGQLPLDLYKNFTKIACAALEKTGALGVYMNSQYLLLPKDYYLSESSTLDEGGLPVTLWMYFGMWSEDGLQSAYTYGLSAFGKYELEIINSKQPMTTVQSFIQETAIDLLLNNTNLRTGDYVGDKKQVAVQVSKGQLIEGQTAKLNY